MSPTSQAASDAKDPSIPALIAAHAASSPDAIAIAAPGRTPMTYGTLQREIMVAVSALNARKLGRGQPVALVLSDGPELAVAFLAVASGAVAAPLNPAYTAPEFDFYLGSTGARALIVQAGIDSPARAVAAARSIPIIELVPSVEAEAGRFTLAGDVGPSPAGASYARSDDVALVLHTSGTTGRPKRVPLTHRNVCASAQNITRTLALRRSDRCLNVAPLFHADGLVRVVLGSLAAGASAGYPPGFDATRFFAWMDELRPTWYTAFPTMHRAILERAAAHQATIAGCPLRFVRSGAAALPPALLAGLETAFGAPVIEGYGLTEALQVTSNPLPPRPRKVGSVGLAAGPEVAIMDEAGQFLPAGQPGEVVVRGANVMDGYADDAESNRRAFVDGWFRTGDQGILDDDGYLFLTGRLKEMINRGGLKIAPDEVDQVLLQHPAVAQAVAFALPDVRLGEDVAAAVVLREGQSVTERDIRDFAEGRLAFYKVPRRVVFLDDLPKGPTGKVRRLCLAQALGLVDPPAVPPVPVAAATGPRAGVEQMIAEIWADVLGVDVDRVGVDDDFLALGGDSILAAQVVARVRQVWSIAVSLVRFFDTPTVAGLALAVEECLLREIEQLSDDDVRRLAG